MPGPAFIVAKLNGQQYSPLPVGYKTREDAIEAIKTHHQINGGADAFFRVYEGDGKSWKPTLVEVIRSETEPMFVFAIYKIAEGEWSNG